MDLTPLVLLLSEQRLCICWFLFVSLHSLQVHNTGSDERQTDILKKGGKKERKGGRKEGAEGADHSL